MKQNWDAATEDAKNFDPGEADFGFPPGSYVARLIKAELTQSQTSGNVQVKWTFRGLAGDIDGTIHSTWENLSTPENFIYLAKKLVRLGYELDEVDVEELPEMLEDISKNQPVVKISVKANGDFPPNVYLNQVFEEDAAEEILSASKWASKTEPAKKSTKKTTPAKPSKPTGKKSSKKTDDEVEEDEDDDEEADDDEDDEEEADEDEFDAMNRKQLVAYAKKNAPDIAVKKSMSDDQIRDAIREAVAEEDDEEDASDEDEVDVEVGMSVAFNDDAGKEKVGVIVALDEDEQTADVKVGKKTFKSVPLSDMELIDDEDDENE
jgi:hypothetical protein